MLQSETSAYRRFPCFVIFVMNSLKKPENLTEELAEWKESVM